MNSSGADYHVSTSYHRFRMSGHALDWSSQPAVFKAYPGQDQIVFPDDLTFSQKTLCDVLSCSNSATSKDQRVCDFASLARVLVLTHTVTARARYGGTDFLYRSVASAGALYPFELYVAALHVPSLASGVYHHQAGTGALVILRRGWPGQEIGQAMPHAAETLPSLVFLVTSIFFRSSWKYRDRAYRYHLLDSGHLLENLTLALKSENLPFDIDLDFDDQSANRLLGIDTEREVCLALVSVTPHGGGIPTEATTGLDAAGPHLSVCSRASPREIQYPSILGIHEATRSSRRTEIPGDMVNGLGLRVDPWHPIHQPRRDVERLSLYEAVMKRRSMRNFVRTQLPANQFLSLLSNLCAQDTGETNRDLVEYGTVAVGFLAGSVEGIDPGFYLIDRRNSSFGLVRPGYMMSSMMQICLDQEWLANCALHFLFVCNLKGLEDAYGPRGYRYAMLEAGRLGQRIYLAATTTSLGCCGIGAFYDSEAGDLLGLAESTHLLYLVAAGPVRKWTTAMHDR